MNWNGDGMTTNNEMVTAMNNAVQAMLLAGAKHPGDNPEDRVLTTRHTGSGWWIVWQDNRNGGVSFVVNLGSSKKDVARKSWDIVAVADAIRMGA